MKYFSLLLTLALIVSCAEKKPEKTESLEEKAQRIHDAVITIDTHDDINVQNFTDSINYTQRLETQINLPKMEEGGLDAVFFNCIYGSGYLDHRRIRQSI